MYFTHDAPFTVPSVSTYTSISGVKFIKFFYQDTYLIVRDSNWVLSTKPVDNSVDELGSNRLKPRNMGHGVKLPRI